MNLKEGRCDGLGWRIASWLVLPLALLLAAQWPLRTLVQAYAPQANDFAQIVFSLFMACAVTAASRRGMHLTATPLVGAPSGRLRAVALAACIVPWALFMLWSTAGLAWNSVRSLEGFPETFNPGYFVIRLALWWMLGLALAHALGAVAGREPHA